MEVKVRIVIFFFEEKKFQRTGEYVIVKESDIEDGDIVNTMGNILEEITTLKKDWLFNFVKIMYNEVSNDVLYMNYCITTPITNRSISEKGLECKLDLSNILLDYKDQNDIYQLVKGAIKETNGLIG